MGKITVSFDKRGIVSQILEGLNPGTKLVPRDKKAIDLTIKNKFITTFFIPKSWEVEETSYGFLLQGGFEEGFSYKLILR